MKKSKALIILPVLVLLLSGCATYSVKKGESPYDKGFVVSRYDRVLPEYTIGKDNSVPDEQIARERFQRRRVEVEKYYKKMGYIENRFKQNFIDPPVFMLQAVLGIFRLPFIAIKDYNYNHDPKYKESVDKQEDANYKAEKERIKSIKDQLSAYIKQDLEKESALISLEQKTAAKTEVKEKTEPVVEAVEEKPAPVARNDIPASSPVAVIIAKPLKGNSPLFVQFNGAKSYSPNGRIVSYLWDFGDGDTSTKKNPTNSYWSATYGKPREYTAKLIVKDNKGQSADSTVVIEVLTK